MDSRHIEVLLEKYWNAETSLEEEKELRAFFASGQVPEQWSEAATLFQYFEIEKTKKINSNFEATVTKKLHERQGGKIIEMKNWFSIARVAAGIAVIVAAVYLIGREARNSSSTAMVDTESDPKLAFEETKKALLMISKNFHKAQREASRINLLNEAQQKIESKKNEKKKVSL
ncbi:MAG TPA: hypothetical protein DGG95_17630 [Cytophagales bacterium]|nr:hypothetical protein [Cytophagales bacterium]